MKSDADGESNHMKSDADGEQLLSTNRIYLNQTKIKIWKITCTLIDHDEFSIFPFYLVNRLKSKEYLSWCPTVAAF